MALGYIYILSNGIFLEIFYAIYEAICFLLTIRNIPHLLQVNEESDTDLTELESLSL